MIPSIVYVSLLDSPLAFRIQPQEVESRISLFVGCQTEMVTASGDFTTDDCPIGGFVESQKVLP